MPKPRAPRTYGALWSRALPSRARRFDLRSLPTRLFLAFVFLAFLLVVAIGVPAVAVTESALRRQLELRADQGESATRALWSASLSRVESLVGLAAQRPTMRRLLEESDTEDMIPYLDDLRTGAGLDGLVVRDARGAVVGRSPADVREPDSVPGPAQTGLELRTDGASVVPVLAAHAPVTRSDGVPVPAGSGIAGRIHGWIDVDTNVLAVLQNETGVTHALYLDGRPIVALSPGLPQGLDDREGRVALTGGEQQVRSVSISLSGHRLSDVLLISTDPLQAARRRVLGLVVASAIGALVLAMAMARFSARHVTGPLRELITETERLGRGDLGRPVVVASGVRELGSLASAFELMRRRLGTAHDDLREAKRWSDGLVASLSEGVVTVDAGGRITSFSAGAERVLGWRAGDVIGRPWFAVLGGDPTGEEPPSFIHTAPGTVARQTTTHRDGRTVTIAISSGGATPERRAGREQVYVMRDVTEEERAMRQREHLLASLSHEFQTPLASLRAGAEILGGAAPDPDLRDLARSMLVSTRRLEELVDNLLGSAGLHAGRFDVRPRPVDLTTVIEDVVLEMAPVVASREQWIEVRGRQPVPEVLADPRRVAQVLVNLLSNASRYAPPRRPIVLRTRSGPDTVHVDVIDEGPGIADDVRPNLFKPFAAGGRDTLGGVGLGLSIAQAIVERHGGTVTAHDVPGGGARFTFGLRRCSS